MRAVFLRILHEHFQVGQTPVDTLFLNWQSSIDLSLSFVPLNLQVRLQQHFALLRSPLSNQRHLLEDDLEARLDKLVFKNRDFVFHAEVHTRVQL